MTPPGQSYSEDVLEGRLVVNVAPDGYGRPRVWIGSIRNRAGSMKLSPLELAALLDGPLERALKEVNGE